MITDEDARARITLRARLAHRLARHVPLTTIGIRPPEALVSLSFDDVPDSACTVGADILDAHGAHATFFVATALLGRRGRHWRNADRHRIAGLHARGHEIGGHTQTHPLLPELPDHRVAFEIDENRRTLAQIVPSAALTSFAYPFGYTSLRAKRLVGRSFASGRGVVPGLNHGLVDPSLLRANPLVDAALPPGRLEALMDLALARRGWLIFFGHDVAEDPSPYGCTPGLVGAVLAAAAHRGIACTTIAEGLRRATASSDGGRRLDLATPA